MSSWVLGVSALYHDSAAALLRDGVVVAAAEEERFSRLKHDASLPIRAARWCMEEAGIGPDQLDHLVYYEKPLRKLERVLVSQALEFPRSFTAFRRGIFKLLTDKVWVGHSLADQLGVDPDRMLFCEHHLSHAASAFYCSPYDEAAILVADGVGEWASTSLYRGSAEGIELLEELHFPHSLGLLYSAFTAFLGFRVNNGEYKVMGLAPYGKPRFTEQVRQVLRLAEDGGFSIDLDAVSYHYSATDSFGPRFVELFGEPRFPGSPIDPDTPDGARFADIAASVQAILQEAMIGLAGRLHQVTGSENLCMAGGVALNSVANRHILEQSPFERLFVQPAAGDAGGALGAALWAWNEVMDKPRSAPSLQPGMGQAWDEAWIQDLLEDLRFDYRRCEDLEGEAAKDLAEGKVIGWFQGRFEWGPRALGQRSILADPTRPDMKDRVNASIKFREAFRPFAPAVLEEEAERYFQLTPGAEDPLRWMLCVVPVQEGVDELLRSTTHVDGSARVQLVNREASPRFHELIRRFGELSGHPVVLNTSFNLKGEPIVSSPVHAISTFERCGLDFLYLGPFRVERGRREA